MRDGEGIFLGHHVCSNYGGLSSYFEKVCCGDRRYKRAKSICLLKGVVEAELVCNAKCGDFVKK